MNKKSFFQYCLILFALLAGFLSAASGQTKVNEPVHQIPFEYELDKVVVPVEVNGKRTVRLILDTGMPEGIFLMKPKSADGMELNYVAANVMLRGAGSGTASARMAMGADLKLGGLGFTDQRVIVMNDEGPLSQTDWDGAIGASIFNQFAVEIDVENQVIKLYSPDKLDPAQAGEELQLTVTRTKPYVSALVNVDGKKDVLLKIVIDTGANAGLMLSAKEGAEFAVPEKTIEGTFGGGVGGDHSGKYARISKLSLGKQEMNNLVTMFNTGPMPVEGDGLIGMGIMKRFLVTFDYSNKRMFLKPNGRIGEPFEFDMIGLYLKPGDDGKLSVQDVFAGSPAEAAGIRKGDTVTTVDGKEVDFAKWLAISGSIRVPGKTIKIAWTRDGKAFTADIVSKRMI